MKTLGPLLVLLTAVVLCLSSAVEKPDIPDTPYDESQPLPYESVSQFPVGFVDAHRQVPKASPVSTVPQRGKSCSSREVDSLNRPEWSGETVCTPLVIRKHSLRC